MKRSPQEKYVLLFEAMKRSLLAADHLFSRLDSELSALEAHIDGQQDLKEQAILPLLTSISFIDFAHRFRFIADALTLINKKAQEMRDLTNTLAEVEKARNYLQHMRGDLSVNDEIKYPLLGSILWARGAKSYTVVLSQPTSANAYSLVYDRFNQCWVSQYQYKVKDATVDVEIVLAKMKETYDWIAKAIEFSDPEFSELKWGATYAYGFQIVQSKT